MHPREISIADYTYELPEEKIAQHPLADRDASRLLIYKDGVIDEDVYRNIPDHLPPGSLLVFNDTKVVEARLLFQKATGGIVEIFCLEPHETYPDITTAMQQQGTVLWHCLVGGASKWKHGQVLRKTVASPGGDIIVEAVYKEKRPGSFVIELSWRPGNLSFAVLLHLAGAIPLPPYMKRKAEADDSERYQTIYAHASGSVAAPTAGLHFTDHILSALPAKNITTAFVTLHVGAGTFKPVKAETLSGHEMHSEFMDVRKSTIETLLAALDKTIIAVGTTSLRTLESLYWLGVKTLALEDQPAASSQIAGIQQWEVYDMEKQDVPPVKALASLLQWMDKNNLERLITRTSIIIAPGYRVRMIKALVTNFHQPQSTLLLLIAALIGSEWKKVYAYALRNGFRFLSYGDGCLLWVDNRGR